MGQKGAVSANGGEAASQDTPKSPPAHSPAQMPSESLTVGTDGCIFQNGDKLNTCSSLACAVNIVGRGLSAPHPS
jgi:hypothetical protein